MNKLYSDPSRINFLSQFLLWALFVLIVTGWVTHVIWWVRLFFNQELNSFFDIMLAILGTFVVPIGSFHGIVLWF